MNLFSEATLQQAKQKKRTVPWARAGWDALAQRVAKGLQASVRIPAEAGGWIHNYVCAEHWLPLVYDGERPTVHECPAGHVCEGEAFDAAWRVWRHRELAELAREGGLAWAVQQSDDGRQLAALILLQYADFYTQFEGQADAESWMLEGHAFNQALTEALWAIPLIHAYDLVADDLTEAQRTRIQQDLLWPMADLMVRSQEKLKAKGSVESNYMAWINVTLVCLGFALGEQEWVTRALSAPVGFNAHLNVAVFEDGFEYEATPYYHTFVLLAYVISAEAARANNIDLYDVVGSKGQTLEMMGLACAKLAWPDGTLPDLGDGSYWQDSIFDAEICQTYELLNGATPHAEFGELLCAAYRRRGVARDNWAALLFGAKELTSAEMPVAVSPDAVLRRTAEAQGWRILEENDDDR